MKKGTKKQKSFSVGMTDVELLKALLPKKGKILKKDSSNGKVSSPSGDVKKRD